VTLARNNIDYTRIVSPADGLVGLRQVRQGQFVNVGTQGSRGVATEYLGDRELQGDADDKRADRQSRRASQSMLFPIWRSPATWTVGRPVAAARLALLPPDNATGNFTKVVQRVPVKIVLDPE
jgi:membrane fusion protein (multidrug efflux system)